MIKHPDQAAKAITRWDGGKMPKVTCPNCGSSNVSGLYWEEDWSDGEGERYPMWELVNTQTSMPPYAYETFQCEDCDEMWDNEDEV